MASLMENLIDILDKECSEYEILLGLSASKTSVIVQGDLDGLQKITDEEQDVISRISHLDKKREEVTTDIADVLNMDVNTLKLTTLIEKLGNRPQEQQKLAVCYDRLKTAVRNMVKVNEQNRELIKTSLEMVEFDLNVIQAAKTAPETANYNKGAFNTGSVMGTNMSGFDAKQ